MEELIAAILGLAAGYGLRLGEEKLPAAVKERAAAAARVAGTTVATGVTAGRRAVDAGAAAGTRAARGAVAAVSVGAAAGTQAVRGAVDVGTATGTRAVRGAVGAGANAVPRVPQPAARRRPVSKTSTSSRVRIRSANDSAHRGSPAKSEPPGGRRSDGDQRPSS